MDAIKEHEEKMLAAFAEVLRAEDAVSDVKKRQAEAETLLQQERNGKEHLLRLAWDAVEAILAETGEVEVLLPGTVTDYKIAYSNPPERVKTDPEAVPDEFCKIERKPKLAEIKEHLKTLRDAGKVLIAF